MRFRLVDHSADAQAAAAQPILGIAPAAPIFYLLITVQLEPLHPIQIERFRNMTPTEKFAVARGLLATARQIRRTAIQRQHPEWPAIDVERELAAETTRART